MAKPVTARKLAERHKRQSKYRSGGNCYKCGVRPPSVGSTICSPCRIRTAGYNKRSLLKRNNLATKFKSQPCTDCGVRLPPEVMEMDHVRGIGAPLRINLACRASTSAVMAELARCEPRCPTCHRIRHFLETNGPYWYLRNRTKYINIWRNKLSATRRGGPRRTGSR